VQALKDSIAAADGLLFVTPEYNSAIPGVAKNAVDRLSRPAADIPRCSAESRSVDGRFARRLRHHRQPERLAAGFAPSAPGSGRKVG
jgi:NAD(P)H-dependent FMN reductase